MDRRNNLNITKRNRKGLQSHAVLLKKKSHALAQFFLTESEKLIEKRGLITCGLLAPLDHVEPFVSDLNILKDELGQKSSYLCGWARLATTQKTSNRNRDEFNSESDDGSEIALLWRETLGISRSREVTATHPHLFTVEGLLLLKHPDVVSFYESDSRGGWIRDVTGTSGA
ncbi:hypothetical protein Sjap_017203 [Stephania japonica]|uniref:Uncharacterized protein n=1 Tax=Stephania japonica TaxID=461633 RepID=A0AAP0I5T8_9MAGN